jgi:sarcosine oxidase
MSITGGLMIGPTDGSVVRGTLRSASEHKLPHQVLTPAQVTSRFPAFQLRGDLVAVFDPRAGYLDPEACNKAHLTAAIDAGGDAHFNEPLLEWTAEGESVRVKTAAGSYLAEKLVLAGGAWTGALVRELELPLVVERQTMFWLEPQDNTPLYDAARFPIFAHEYKANNICYGFPRLARGVKASVMHDGETAVGPDRVRRTMDPGEVEPLRKALRPILPRLSEAPVNASGTCLFTNTPDHDFIIDFHPEHPQVLISSPCSGHGFKFASAIGELQAKLLMTGDPGFDLTPFRIDRWSHR